jgi:hypothetical protein
LNQSNFPPKEKILKEELSLIEKHENSIKEYEEEVAVNKQEFTTDHQINFTDFNFSI